MGIPAPKGPQQTSLGQRPRNAVTFTSSPSPERATHAGPRASVVTPFQGLISGGISVPGALPRASLSGPFGAESPCPVSALQSLNIPCFLI